MPPLAGIWGGFARKLTYLPFPPRSSIPAKAGISLFCRQRRGFAASPLESGDSRFRGNGDGGIWGEFGNGGAFFIWGEWGGFPSHSSIPAKAGIFAVMDAFDNRGIPLRGKRFLPSQEWNGGIPAKINILPIPAKAGRDSRASGNGMRGEWKGSVGGGGIKGVWGVGEKKAPGGGLLGDMGVRCPLGCLGGWTLPRGRHQKRLPFPGWK